MDRSYEERVRVVDTGQSLWPHSDESVIRWVLLLNVKQKEV